MTSTPPEANPSNEGAFSHDDTWGQVRVRFAGKGWTGGLEGLVPDGVETAWLEQIHSADVHGVSEPGCAGRGDALFSGRSGLALAVVTADCVPVLLAGEHHLAAVHAGWRGVVAEVVAATAGRFPEPPRVAWIGPAISGEVYEVGEEVAGKVAAVSGPEVVLEGTRGRPHVDLQRAVALQLAALGVEDVRRIDLCTQSRADILHSYRRDGAGAGRNRSLIWRIRI